MLDKITDITEGRGKPEDIENLQDLSHDIINTSLCGLGQTAPNPVLTTIRYFKDEYDSHIHDGWCKAHRIEQVKCIKCRSCFARCKFGSVRTGPASLRDELLKKQEVEA
jgi:MinD superfamily P-loop ATPase